MACKLPFASVLAILLTSPVEVTLETLYDPAPVLISACPGSVTAVSSAPKSASTSPVPSTTTVLNEIALTAPVPASSRPTTLSVAICSMSAKETAPPLSVTQPSVTSNLLSSNAALPKSA